MITIPVKTLKAHLTAIAAGVKAAGFDTVRVSLDGGALVFTLQNGSTYTIPDAAGDGITSFVYSFRNFKQEIGHIKNGDVVLSEVLHKPRIRHDKILVPTINDARLWSQSEFHLMNTPPSAPFAEMLAIDLLALLQTVNAATMASDDVINSIFQTVHLDFDGATLSANAMDGKHWVRRNVTLTKHRAAPRAFQADRHTVAAWIEALKILVKTKRGDTIVSFAADENWLSLITADRYDTARNTFTALVAGCLDFTPTSWVSEDKLIGDSEAIGHFDFEDVGTLQAALKNLPEFENPGYEGEFVRLGEDSLGSRTTRERPESSWQIHGGALTLTQPDLYQLPKLYLQRDQLGRLLAGMNGAVKIEIMERKIISTWDKSVTIAYMIRVSGNRAVGMMTCVNKNGV